MGFVERHRFMSFPDAARPFAAKQVKAIVALQAKIAELDETAPLRPRAAKRRADKMAKLKREGAFAPQRQELTTQLADARKALDHWKSANGVSAIQQGWFPGEHDRIGAWDLVEDEPQSLQESFYPLYPLVADPNDPQHDATGRTMYFGLIPASSFDADVNGKHRYDDESRYQIRCFVRRHNIGCPRKVDAVPDCEGELVWSLPTAHYQLAPQFDLEGTSNRPITIKMPNLAELAAQAVKRPFGKFSPVKFIQPQGLGPQTDGKALLGGSMSGMQICFFSIPLITIIALFVLNIFLPIVVFVFGLWFLLAFKFCIPPSISLNAGIQAELDVVGSAGIDIDADFSVDVNGTFKTTLDINTDLKVGVSTDFATTTQLPQGDIESGLDVFANSPLVDLNGINVETAALPKTVADDPAVIDFSAGLEFEEHRSVGEGAGA